jgi:hypothetical protein
MTVAFVLGNGLSRSGIDLSMLRCHGPIYGCNALYRDFAPDVLVATDRLIAEKIQHSGYAQNNMFYTRNPLPDLGAKCIPKHYWNFSSGGAALGIAADEKYTTIYLLGFDMGPAKNNKFNNIYADTEFYKTSKSVPTYTGNWIAQVAKVAKRHATVQFVRVVGPNTATIPDLQRIENLKHLSLPEFLKQLNNG